MTDAGTGALDAAAGAWLTDLAGLSGPDAGDEDCPPALWEMAVSLMS